MSFFSPLVAAVSSAVQVAAATAAPLGATAAKAATGSTAATVLKKGLTPTSNATLSPDILKTLQAQATHQSGFALKFPLVTHAFAALFVVCAVGLIFLLAVQTTKQEGLSGTIGGRVESTYRPRLGFDQQLARLTSYVALTMVFFAVVLSITGI